MISYSKFEHTYFTPFRHIEPISKDYTVFVNGKEIPVYTCRISKIPFNRPWPGHQREVNQTEIVSFVNIVSDETVDIRVDIHRPYKTVSLRPFAKEIKLAEQDGTVAFSLDEGQFVLSCDDFHGCLYIFHSRPIICEDTASVTHYFGPGVHMPGKIQLHDNESIYVDKDALVFGCIYAENTKNIHIFGNGLFDDSTEERAFRPCYENFTNGNIKFYDCENIRVEGVLFRNSAIWCVNLFHCFDVVLDNIKVFGQWRYNTDGVDIVNCQNITLKNSFVHSFDDSVTIKGIDRYIETNNENILTDNCILWCDWGKTCEIGLETACREYKNITFRNCHILRGGNTALDIQNGDCAEVSNVLFENISVEYNSFDNYPVLQKDDDSVYDAHDKPMVPNLIAFSNVRFRGGFYQGHIPPEHAPVDLTGIAQTCVHNITVRNIKVYYDERIEKRDGKYNVPISVRSVLEDTEFYNILVENVTVNGEPLTMDNAIPRLDRVRNFVLQ